jgi:hypothetical protein
LPACLTLSRNCSASTTSAVDAAYKLTIPKDEGDFFLGAPGSNDCKVLSDFEIVVSGGCIRSGHRTRSGRIEGMAVVAQLNNCRADSFQLLIDSLALSIPETTQGLHAQHVAGMTPASAQIPSTPSMYSLSQPCWRHAATKIFFHQVAQQSCGV